jgi:HEAT repeat protein
MDDKPDVPNSQRKLFFGLFVFPLLIAVGMAVLLCAVVLMTHENQTPDTLIAAIKKSSPSKRWQKAFELSNELNRQRSDLRNKAVLNEIIQILETPESYDSKTRGYMALALTYFDQSESRESLRKALSGPEDDVRLYVLWALGVLGDESSAPDVAFYLKSDSPDVRKTAAYVLGVLGQDESREGLYVLLDDAVADVRWNTALALARLHDASGVDVLMKMLERQELSGQYGMDEDQIEAVMVNAAKGLALIRKPESIKILEAVSHHDKNMKVRQAAMNALDFQLEKKS